MPYPVINTILDEAYPAGSLNYWLSNFTTGLTDGLIDAMAEQYASVPSEGTVLLLEHFHGAVCRVGVTDTAVPHRAEGWNLVIPGTWFDPAATEANVAWVRETHAALKPHLTEAKWLNYLADDQGEDAVRAAYGPNYDRLREVKRRLDPDNVFHHNHNIAP
jgi:FAD/FMN-containing dehydrogenase